MIKKYTYKSVTWVDVENPTTEDVRDLVEEFSVNTSVAKDLQLPTYKEKIAMHKNYLYLVMHFPILRRGADGDAKDQEVDFIVGKDFIITTRYESIDALERFQKTFEVNSILHKEKMTDHAGYVFYYIIKELYKAISDEVDSLNDSLERVEKSVFRGKEKEMVWSISNLNRDLLHLNHTVNSHKEIFETLPGLTLKFFGEEFADNCDKLLNEYYRIHDVMENSVDFLKELRDTNDSLLNTKQNQIMKTLTILTFLALPFTVITGFFQMNTINTPFIGYTHDWPIIVSTEVIAVVVLLVLARFKKWL
ncbi:MAG: CorA family divalent cation transporter [Candidatus Paceibacterota bacterium]|jgi:magnesium transporter